MIQTFTEYILKDKAGLLDTETVLPEVRLNKTKDITEGNGSNARQNYKQLKTALRKQGYDLIISKRQEYEK